MPDDLTNRHGTDRKLIAMQEKHEVRYWTQALGVSEEELQKVVDRVGHSVAAVRKALGKS